MSDEATLFFEGRLPFLIKNDNRPTYLAANSPDFGSTLPHSVESEPQE